MSWVTMDQRRRRHSSDDVDTIRLRGEGIGQHKSLAERRYSDEAAEQQLLNHQTDLEASRKPTSWFPQFSTPS